MVGGKKPPGLADIVQSANFFIRLIRGSFEAWVGDRPRPKTRSTSEPSEWACVSPACTYGVCLCSRPGPIDETLCSNWRDSDPRQHDALASLRRGKLFVALLSLNNLFSPGR